MVNLVVRKGADMSRRGDNMRKRADGRWEGRYKCMGKDGRYRYKSVYGKTYGEAKKRMGELQAEEQMAWEKISISDSGYEISFCEIAEKWLLNVSNTRKHSTYMKYRKTYDRHIKKRLEQSSISDITMNYINRQMFSAGNAGISNNMRHDILAIINQILRYADEFYGYSTKKLPNRRTQKEGKKIEIINHTEQALLLRYLYKDTDNSKMGIILCLSLGLRLGEICSLKWEDIDFSQMIIHVNRTVQRIAVSGEMSKTVLMETAPKSSFSAREIPISESIVQLLNSVRHDGEYVICGNKPMEPRTYQNHFKKYLKALNIKDYNFHTLRHTFATNCIDSGMDVKSLSEILGHSNVQITLNRYVHPTMECKRKYICSLSAIYGQYCGQDRQEY